MSTVREETAALTAEEHRAAAIKILRGIEFFGAFGTLRMFRDEEAQALVEHLTQCAALTARDLMAAEAKLEREHDAEHCTG